MVLYIDDSTGVYWTEDEVRAAYEEVAGELGERYASFDEYLDEMVRRGRDGIGGLLEVEGPFYVVSTSNGDEFTEGKFVDAGDAIVCARRTWDRMTDHDKKRTRVEVRRYLDDIESEDCDCFDYDTIDF